MVSICRTIFLISWMGRPTKNEDGKGLCNCTVNITNLFENSANLKVYLALAAMLDLWYEWKPQIILGTIQRIFQWN